MGLEVELEIIYPKIGVVGWIIGSEYCHHPLKNKCPQFRGFQVSVLNTLNETHYIVNSNVTFYSVSP